MHRIIMDNHHPSRRSFMSKVTVNIEVNSYAVPKSDPQKRTRKQHSFYDK